MTIQEHFSNREFCLKQVIEARQIFSNKNTTREQYNAMEEVLGYTLLYCPEDISCVVQATLEEAGRRRISFETHFWIK